MTGGADVIASNQSEASQDDSYENGYPIALWMPGSEKETFTSWLSRATDITTQAFYSEVNFGDEVQIQTDFVSLERAVDDEACGKMRPAKPTEWDSYLELGELTGCQVKVVVDSLDDENREDIALVPTGEAENRYLFEVGAEVFARFRSAGVNQELAAEAAQYRVESLRYAAKDYKSDGDNLPVLALPTGTKDVAIVGLPQAGDRDFVDAVRAGTVPRPLEITELSDPRALPALLRTTAAVRAWNPEGTVNNGNDEWALSRGDQAIASLPAAPKHEDATRATGTKPGAEEALLDLGPDRSRRESCMDMLGRAAASLASLKSSLMPPKKARPLSGGRQTQ